jgi:hypothetical protein
MVTPSILSTFEPSKIKEFLMVQPTRTGPYGGDSVIRELDHRRSDGVSVTLLWNAETNRVSVSVVEERRDVAFEFAIRASDALDAFNHPYAYAVVANDDGALADDQA